MDHISDELRKTDAMQKSKPGIRTISSNEAKQRWGSVVASVINDGDEVVVESHGKPTVAVISYHEFIEYQEHREHQRKAAELRRFRDLEAKASDTSQRLSEEEIEELSVYIGREINQKVAERQRAIWQPQER